MITTLIELIRFGFSLLFGVALSVCFAGIEYTRKNKSIGFFCLILLIVQASYWWLFGIDFTAKLYPLIAHLPMILFLIIYFKRPWLISIVSVFFAYLYCQVPRWIGIIGGTILGSRLSEHICYIAAVFWHIISLKYMWQILFGNWWINLPNPASCWALFPCYTIYSIT